MTVTVFTPEKLFAEIGERQFDRYDAFQDEIQRCFSVHALEFPVGYSWRDALDWALKRQVVERREGRIVIHPTTTHGLAQ